MVYRSESDLLPLAAFLNEYPQGFPMRLTTKTGPIAVNRPGEYFVVP